MKTFTEVAAALDSLKLSGEDVILKCDHSKSKSDRIRSTATRKGFRVKVIQCSGGYRVGYSKGISAEAQAGAIRSKTKINNAYQASKQKDWDPANPLDPLLHSLSLEEKMISVKTAGGGSFKTLCKVGQIRKAAQKCGVNYAQEDCGHYRLVLI